MEQYQDLGLVVGENLKRLIKENFGTQEKFAEAFGAEVRTVNRWVNRGIDKLSLITQIAQFLQVPVLAILPY